MKDNTRYKLHPLQLQTIKVLELTIKANPAHEDNQSTQKDFSFLRGHSDYDAEQRTINVKIGATIGENSENAAFSLKVELVGVFHLRNDEFPIDKIEKWAEFNAPLVLYPYLREHVYSLTMRAGFNGTLLPLFEVPTFKTE